MKNARRKRRAFVLQLIAILTNLVVALRAVNRTITAGLEGNLGGTAALCAGYVEHLALATGLSVVIVVAASCTASGATAGLVLEALVSIELLLGSGENEFCAALTAYQSLVFEHGKKPPKCIAYLLTTWAPNPVIGRDYHRRETVKPWAVLWGCSQYIITLSNCTALFQI